VAQGIAAMSPERTKSTGKNSNHHAGGIYAPEIGD